MSVYFNGQLITSPATRSRVDDSALANQNLSVGNVLALIGPSAGGAPNTPLVFGSPSQAKDMLLSGELLDAVVKAFSPSTETGGPSSVTAIRVNPATQSTLNLLDSSSATAIALTSSDYGLYTKQIKVKIESGSVNGKRLTTQYGSTIYSQDNIYKPVFSLQYGGAQASATMTVAATSIVLSAPSGTILATIDLTVYQTIQQVVDFIGSVTGFTASVLGGFGSMLAANALDFVSAVDVKSALYSTTATLQACVDWFNGIGEGFVNATRGTGGLLPANLAFTYLSGGSDGTITNTQWSNAYTTLQTVDAQWVVPITGNAAIHAMNSAHCQFMSTVMAKERRGVVGPAAGTTDAAALPLAAALNDDRTSYVHLGYMDYDANSNLVLLAPYRSAVIVAAMFAGVDPGTPLTNKTISVQGLERNLRNPTDTDVLIDGGILCLESTSQGFKIVKSISTWLADDNYDKVEVSCGVAVDFTMRNVRQALDILRGNKNSPLQASRAVSITKSTLSLLSVAEPQGPGVLVGDANSPPFKNISATVTGDVLQVQYQCSPAIPDNYILVTAYLVPYSGTATAS